MIESYNSEYFGKELKTIKQMDVIEYDNKEEIFFEND